MRSKISIETLIPKSTLLNGLKTAFLTVTNLEGKWWRIFFVISPCDVEKTGGNLRG